MAKHNPTNTDVLGGGPMLGFFSIFWVGGWESLQKIATGINKYFFFLFAKGELSKQRYIQPVPTGSHGIWKVGNFPKSPHLWRSSSRECRAGGLRRVLEKLPEISVG